MTFPGPDTDTVLADAVRHEVGPVVAALHLDAAWSAGFFKSQAESMLHGRIDVQPSDILGECFLRDSRCYGYFGITPSVVRIPVIGILRYVRSALTPLRSDPAPPSGAERERLSGPPPSAWPAP